MCDLPPGVEVVDESCGHYRVTSQKTGTEQWVVTSKYKITQHLGSGSYGSVVRAQLAGEESTTVVIKRTANVLGHAHVAKCSLREIAIMRRLNHPNIVKILDILEPQPGTPPAASAAACAAQAVTASSNTMFKNLYVVLEDGGVDLKTFLDQRNDVLTLPQMQHISRQICSAVAYLHSCRVVHRDLKPANILIDPNPQSPTYLHVRIADFGASRSVELPLGTDIPPPCLASSPPSPRAIRKSKSEANFLASAADSEFRTVAGEDGMHACLEMGMEHMSINDDFQTNGSGPM